MFGFGKKSDEKAAASAGWLERLQQGLGKTRTRLGERLGSLFSPGRKLDETFYEELETVLLSADGHRVDISKATRRSDCLLESPPPVLWVDFGAVGMASLSGSNDFSGVEPANHHFAALRGRVHPGNQVRLSHGLRAIL
jgi:hypothetical protein